MTIAVYYYTRSGNTEKLAKAIAEELGVHALSISSATERKADVTFLGTSPYAFDIDPAVKKFIEENHENLGTLVCFGTSASGMSTHKKVKLLAERLGVPVLEEHFNCPGHFAFMHKSRPNEEDVAAACVFAQRALALIKSTQTEDETHA